MFESDSESLRRTRSSVSSGLERRRSPSPADQERANPVTSTLPRRRQSAAPRCRLLPRADKADQGRGSGRAWRVSRGEASRTRYTRLGAVPLYAIVFLSWRSPGRHGPRFGSSKWCAPKQRSLLRPSAILDPELRDARVMHAPARNSAPKNGKTLQIAGSSFSRPLSRILRPSPRQAARFGSTMRFGLRPRFRRRPLNAVPVMHR